MNSALAKKIMIRPGHINEVNPDSGNWIYIDIGFSNKSKSCGLLFGNNEPEEVLFNEAVEKICAFIKESSLPINLVVEAPLSVSFDKKGNPKGRKIEKQKEKTRYWYVGLGCVVLVGALYLLRAISNLNHSQEVRLFEGFISFKNKNEKSNHSKDVKILREIVNSSNKQNEVISEAELRMDATDKLQSSFLVSGLDYGIPPVLMRNG